MSLVQLATSKGAIAIYALLLAAIEKKFQFIKPGVKWVESHKGILKAALREVGVFGSDVLHSPALAGVELEAKHFAHEVENSDLYKTTTAVLHNLSKRVENLTSTDINVVAPVIVTEAKRLFGKEFTVDQVKGVIAEIQKLFADVAPQPNVKAANQITAPVPQSPPTPPSAPPAA